MGEIKRHVRLFVNTLFDDRGPPSIINRRFYPSREDLRKMIYRRRQQILHGLLDQQYLMEKVDGWKKERPADSWFVRLSLDGDSSDQAVRTPLLIVYQSDWMRRLLNLYGQELVFLDATYKTTQYAIPLFFLAVQSNSGYIVVAAVVMEREDTASLSEALKILAEMNPGWSPKAFMIDSSEIEMNAIASIFQGIQPRCDLIIIVLRNELAGYYMLVNNIANIVGNNYKTSYVIEVTQLHEVLYLYVQTQKRLFATSIGNKPGNDGRRK